MRRSFFWERGFLLWTFVLHRFEKNMHNAQSSRLAVFPISVFVAYPTHVCPLWETTTRVPGTYSTRVERTAHANTSLRNPVFLILLRSADERTNGMKRFGDKR